MICLRTIFLQRLPINARSTPATRQGNLETVSSMVDKISEITITSQFICNNSTENRLGDEVTNTGYIYL